MVADPRTLQPVPRDGATIGEIMLTGNTLMKGYLKNEAATDEAFAGGFYHSGDLAVWHGDGSIEVKDRSKDIIISGGENISSLEVEEVLYRHPQVMEAAVVARSDEKWGEHPCAFVTLKPGSGPITADDIIAFCRANMAHFKVPRTVIFGAAAEDLDRQDPEIRSARQGQGPDLRRLSRNRQLCDVAARTHLSVALPHSETMGRRSSGTFCGINHCCPGFSHAEGFHGKHRIG